jgi:hypothetical protein
MHTCCTIQHGPTTNTTASSCPFCYALSGKFIMLREVACKKMWRCIFSSVKRDERLGKTEQMKGTATEETGVFSVFFRTMELLLSSRCRRGAITVYGGVDNKGREEAFKQKCCEMLSAFEKIDKRWYNQFVQRVGRIVGTVSYTKFWQIPRSIEINYEDMLNRSTVDLAAILVCETTRARLYHSVRTARLEQEKVCAICMKQEVRFRERVCGTKLTEEEILQLEQDKPWTRERRVAMLRKAHRNLEH